MVSEQNRLERVGGTPAPAGTGYRDDPLMMGTEYKGRPVDGRYELPYSLAEFLAEEEERDRNGR